MAEPGPDGPENQRAFAAEIGRRLGLRDYRPLVIRDPIAHWIETDCHQQPPSPPNTDYRRLHRFVKPAKDRDNKRRLAAHWIAASTAVGATPCCTTAA